MNKRSLKVAKMQDKCSKLMVANISGCEACFHSLEGNSNPMKLVNECANSRFLTIPINDSLYVIHFPTNALTVKI